MLPLAHLIISGAVTVHDSIEWFFLIEWIAAVFIHDTYIQMHTNII